MDLRDRFRKAIMEAEEKDKHNGDESKKAKWYVDVQNMLDKDKNPLGPSQVAVMKSLGIEDDPEGVNRSLFGKKLHRETNSEGGEYEFTIEELGRIRAALGGL